MQWLLRSATDYVREGLEPLGYKVRYPEEVIRDRLSVFLSASHPVTHGSWPYPPNVIEVGSLHLRDPKPLPRDLKKFMDSAARGVVYVSFGSTIKPSQMPKEKLSAFIETFKMIEESVLWKWDADMQGLPKNVLTSPWVPQQDVLGHPNLKVFVTHGGMGSVMEAIHHKGTNKYDVRNGRRQSKEGRLFEFYRVGEYLRYSILRYRRYSLSLYLICILDTFSANFY